MAEILLLNWLRISCSLDIMKLSRSRSRKQPQNLSPYANLSFLHTWWLLPWALVSPEKGPPHPHILRYLLSPQHCCFVWTLCCGWFSVLVRAGQALSNNLSFLWSAQVISQALKCDSPVSYLTAGSCHTFARTLMSSTLPARQTSSN